MDKKVVSYLQLHFAVLLYGLTAILGDLISLSAISLVWWRVLITSFSLLFFIKFGLSILRLPRLLVFKYAMVGILVALHWLTFYGAIKFSNASIVLAALATTSLFTSFVEPLITGKKFSILEAVLGLLIVPPMLLIANNIDLSMMKGLWIGLISAFLASLFACYNKKWIDQATSYEISFIEMFSAFIFISLFLPFYINSGYTFMPNADDWVYLIVLSLVCTTLAYVISMKALKHVSAFDANLVINMEPVYGIILAIVILKEHKEMNANFYWGMVLIMVIVFSHPLLNKILYSKK